MFSREENPVVEKRTITYFHADSMSFDLLILLIESYDLRLHVGNDLLPLISTVLTNPRTAPTLSIVGSTGMCSRRENHASWGTP